ncbi:thioredoxin-disulfide reductase [Acidaminobacter hydrogenoformans]|uniref:Thioredoxin reductase n=1 Tax=Acidaminobacter hydrogenoformans DSM 2784 TaxID=1120920 RepID=A0A1G5S744_9FIRM|nr:thioredoxin-disulfide reductase [Acidaminobacter hydrogenoformans]SCZ81957.1 thioredoxin reductase (NADPH) [Acidaminobacter hydrogenoformans DSM 2784]
MEKHYDVVIIGAGPAGLSAGLYAARAKMKTVILEKEKPGGQIATTDEVANYPGSVEHATGPSLVDRMVEQCDEFGAERVKDAVKSIDFTGDLKVIETESGDVYKAKAVIVATGASPKKIGCPGEAELTGKGVSYCATCDADFFTDLEVFCVGGGDTAVEEAMYLTKFARKVTLVHRRDEFRAAKSIIEKVKKNEKVEYLMDSVVEEIYGDGILEGIKVKNVKTGEVTDIPAPEDDGTMGVFVFIGYDPLTSLFKGILDMDQTGYLIADENMKTNIPGVFAAGDVRQKILRQVVTATADGAIAAVVAEKYIEEKFHA